MEDDEALAKIKKVFEDLLKRNYFYSRTRLYVPLLIRTEFINILYRSFLICRRSIKAHTH